MTATVTNGTVSDKHPIKAYRERQMPPLSQGQLGKDIGVTRFTILRWEKGWPIDVEKLSDVVKVTGIPAKELRPDITDKLERLEELVGGAA